MVGEAFAGIGAIKSAIDILKSLKDGDTAAKVGAVALDLQQKLSAALKDYDALAQSKRALEAELADIKDWQREKQRYELKTVGTGVVGYMLKPAERGVAAPHWVCPTCFDNRKKSYLQFSTQMSGGMNVYRCTGCDAAITTRTEPVWID